MLNTKGKEQNLEHCKKKPKHGKSWKQVISFSNNYFFDPVVHPFCLCQNKHLPSFYFHFSFSFVFFVYLFIYCTFS